MSSHDKMNNTIIDSDLSNFPDDLLEYSIDTIAYSDYDYLFCQNF